MSTDRHDSGDCGPRCQICVYEDEEERAIEAELAASNQYFRGVHFGNTHPPSWREPATDDDEPGRDDPCPECLVGKHGNCDDSTWSRVLDEPVLCPCSLRGHGR